MSKVVKLKSPPKLILPQKTTTMLPVPVGHRLLIALPEVSEKTQGGVYKTDKEVDVESVSSVTGMVLALGDGCYKNPRIFGEGATPWCKKGDWVIFRAFEGSRLRVFGKEFRFINDDSVMAIVDDPRGIVRA